ncbi:DUF397 domain-containing protein [Actinomadura sp. BRA 177]|uniref:DUF397 domain-containing protein n=1 Tax=Actinomadura sp. BRA 177 TaxID=2745202 RepID=UPI001595CCE3|nr:DUF397 domain-containing protein [Actinomadura sp. BRA 177]NVI88657.1 DUF397 domain-containing protein [Actinomadura sp. BRA 177]
MELSRTNWRKSSRSSAGGQECVEVAAIWRRSSRSSAGGQNCVEVAGTPKAVLIRDSKDTASPPHVIAPETFRNLVGRIKSGRLDL